MPRSRSENACILRHDHETSEAATSCSEAHYKRVLVSLQDALWNKPGWREGIRRALRDSGFSEVPTEPAGARSR